MPILGHNFKTPPPRLLSLWILLAALLNCLGWVLSGLHALTPAGYAVSLLLITAALGWTWKALPAPMVSRFHWGRLKGRFRKPFPLACLLLMALAILGGVLYPPSNYDGLSYRIPRLLHWLDAGHWHWIHTEFQRINTRAQGWEWIAAPLLALTQSLRGLFLISAISFVFLPGLIFSTFVRLGVRGRVAWYWMWILPCGYCFLLQAGSIGNELIGILFSITALNFALRARASGRISEVWISGLSAAMMTAGKASNLPLLLPWAIALFPSLKLLLRRPLASAAVILCALGASLLPITAANLKYSGDWLGLTAEMGETPFANDPLIHIPVNTALLTLQNFAPPIFPGAEKWNAWVDKSLPANLKERLNASFEPGAAKFQLWLMNIEEGAGLGTGITSLLILSIVAACFTRPSKIRVGNKLNFLLLAAPWVAFLVVMQKSGLTALARIISPYYLFVIPALIVGSGQVALVRKTWWKAAAFATFPLALLPLLFSPARPLWPVQTVIAKFNHSNNPLVPRARAVYAAYSNRANAFSPVTEFLPPDVSVLGLVTSDDPETSLWFPMGSRRIVHVTHSDKLEDLRRKDVKYILVSPRYVRNFPRDSSKWIAKMGLTPITKIPLTLRAGEGALDWTLVKLPSTP